MSKKDREGSLDPAFSINRFGDVGLDLESEIGLMEIEHRFHDRDGHAREGSTTRGKLKIGHGKGGSTCQGKCATLTPPMLGHEIEEELVAEN
ncbi:hypothetical protein AHAS_Ahas13G0127300 [Arachis hypogaea]